MMDAPYRFSFGVRSCEKELARSTGKVLRRKSPFFPRSFASSKITNKTLSLLVSLRILKFEDIIKLQIG